MAKIQLHRAGFELSASDAEIEDLSQQFEKKHAIRLDEFLDPGLLAFVQKAVETANFVPREHGSIKRELCMTRDSLAYHMLMLLANNSQLLAFVQRLTGSPPLASYVGRIYRFPPGPEYFDRWHDDVGDGRQVAMSVNLSPEVYEGGLLEMREDGRLLCQVANTAPAGVLFFRIRDGLQHHITTVTGTVPKTAFAGWFIDEPHSAVHLNVVRGDI